MPSVADILADNANKLARLKQIDNLIEYLDEHADMRQFSEHLRAIHEGLIEDEAPTNGSGGNTAEVFMKVAADTARLKLISRVSSEIKSMNDAEAIKAYVKHLQDQMSIEE